MIEYGIIGALAVIALTLFPVIMEAIAKKKNPTPRICNADKRFIEITKIKTRDMFECIKR